MKTIAIVGILFAVVAITVLTFTFVQERAAADACHEQGGIPAQGDNTVLCLNPEAVMNK